METKRIALSVPTIIKIRVDRESEEDFMDLIQEIEDGNSPRWIRNLIKDGKVLWDQIVIDRISSQDGAFGPEDELDFEE